MFRELDENGDIKAGTFVYKRVAVANNIATQIQQWARENPLDLSYGIDWQMEFSDLNTGRLTAQIRDIAFSCANVTAVSKKMEFTLENRILNISFRVDTTYGEQSVGVTVNA